MTVLARELTSWLTGRISERTGLRRDEIDLDLPFRDLGIGSVESAELTAELTAVVGAAVDPVLAFEYPTIRTLAEALTGARPASRPGPRPDGGGPAVAIVGMSVRVPGADSADGFWRLLLQGRDPVAEVPAARWRLDPDALTDAERGAGFAGLLSDIESFDAGFFRIPPAEAVLMDPQQRLLLEGSWEALEDAGQVAADLAGSDTGVYVGISANDYVRRQLGDLDRTHALTPTGNALSVAANRLSYQFDLRGPSIAVDTACSSSLVGVHMAVRDLRAGSCRLALAAGVNLLVEPDASVALARAGMLAPDGRCKPFDAAANGYVRAEGCIVVVLKPLQQALSDGDRVYAVILGSHVNQDGRSNGLTAPNPAAQEAVLLGAYADAQTDPRAVQYIECHGTGTLLGDPIEARALGAQVGAGRPPESPCLIGSVKSNIGHLEAAAGLVGLAKTALSLHHGRLPGTLHYRAANPHIDLPALGLRVVDTERCWPGPPQARIAGVSSFGFGGTNAHVVLASPAAVQGGAGAAAAAGAASAAGLADRSSAAVPVVIPVSARRPESLLAAAHALADRLDELAGSGDVDLTAVAAATALHRTHHNWRRAAVGGTATELAAQLRAIQPHEPAEVRPDRRIVFAFPGQAGHAPEALLTLADASPMAAATMRRCDEIIMAEAGWSLLEVLRGADAERKLRENTELAQPAAVAAQLVMAAAWQGIGIRPAEVIGQSLGEVAAAAVAGGLSLAQALRVAVARGRAISAVIGTGRMLAMAVGEQEAAEIVAAAGQQIAVATVNGPDAVVLAGDAESLDQVRLRAEAAGTLARWVPVDYPSHSPWMAGAAADLTAALAGLDAGDPALPFWSATDAGPLAGPPDAGYWGRNLRSTVRFADAASAALGAGPVTVVELGVHPVLRMPFSRLSAAAGADMAFVSTMERGADPVRHLLAGLARLYELGAGPRWEQLVKRTGYLPVPTYRWHRERHWLPRSQSLPGQVRGAHPLLGRKLDLAPARSGRRDQWELRLTGEPPAVAAGHAVGGSQVLSAAGYLEMALAAGRQLGIAGPIEVRDARFAALLHLAGSPVTVQTIAEARADGGFDITVASRRDTGSWLVNATAIVAPAEGLPEPPPVADPATARATCFHPIAAPVFYDTLGSMGLDYSGGYRALDEIWHDSDTAVASVRCPDQAGPLVLDPRTLDCALQLTSAATRISSDTRPVVHSVRRLVVAGPVAGSLSAVAKVADRDTGARSAAAVIFAGQQPVVTVEDLQVAAVAATPAPASDRQLHWYEPAWRRQDDRQVPHRDLAGSAWAVVTSGTGIGADAAARLRAAGARVHTADATQQDWHRLVADLRDAGPLGADLAYLAGTGQQQDARQVSADVTALASLIRAVAAAGVEVHRVWVVTAGSQDVTGTAGPVRPGSGALWGLVRVLPFEIPTLRPYCVDLDPDPDPTSLDGLMAEFRAPSAESEVALRDGGRYVARIAIAEAVTGLAGAEPVSPDGSYLVTGGLGAIGLRVARWLAASGAGSIGLLGRTPPDADTRQVIAELERAGSHVCVFSGDVGDPLVVAAATAELRKLGPIRGVAHAAGTLRDGPLLDMQDDAIETVLRPKVAGALCLAEVTSGDPLDWVMYFSSAAAVLGSPGQANYCAANAFLDCHAAAQRAQGRPAIVVNWGAWADGGLAAGTAGARGHLAAAYAALDPDAGIEAMAAVIGASRPRSIVLASDLRHLLRLLPPEAATARFSELASAHDALLQDIGLGAPRSARPALEQAYTPPRNELERRIAGIWQRSLGFHQVGVHDGFFELGGDSVFANQMLLELNRTMGVEITAADAFDDLTVARVAVLAEQAMIERIDSMTDEEAELLLRRSEDG